MRQEIWFLGSDHRSIRFSLALGPSADKESPLLEFGSGLIICASVICATNRTKQGPQVSIANLRLT